MFYSPSKVLYSGDLLFIGGTPIVWHGPTSNWIKACDETNISTNKKA